MNKLKLKYLKCIASTNIFFKKGKKYPIISYNNGITVLGEINEQNHEHKVSEILFDHVDGIYGEKRSIIFESKIRG